MDATPITTVKAYFFTKTEVKSSRAARYTEPKQRRTVKIRYAASREIFFVLPPKLAIL